MTYRSTGLLGSFGVEIRSRVRDDVLESSLAQFGPVKLAYFAHDSEVHTLRTANPSTPEVLIPP